MKYILLLVMICLLVLNDVLPYEQDWQGGWVPFAFCLKIVLLGLTLMSCLWGIGYGFGRLWGWLPSDSNEGPFLGAVQILAATLLGAFLVGVVTFLVGRLVGPHHALVWGVLGVGLWLFWFYFAALASGLKRVCTSLKRFWYESTLGGRFLIGLVSFCAVVRVFPIFTFQTHDDPFLYHLSLSEIWIDLGTAGVVVDNITSGYSLAVEHLYLFLKLYGGGNSEQNALAQWIQCFLGWGTFLACLLALFRHVMNSFERVVLALLFLSPNLLFFALLPKNDAFVAAIGGLAFLGLRSRKIGLFYGACFMALGTKVTAAVGLVAIGLHYLLGGLRVDLRQRLSVLTHGALLCVVPFAAFGINNYLVTGNPLFPLMNNIFKSPYGPQMMESVVGEMTPFSFSLESLMAAVGALFQDQPLIPVCLVLSTLSLIYLKAQGLKLNRGPRELGSFLGFGLMHFLVILVFLGPYGPVESRHYLLALGILLPASVMLLLRLVDSRRGRQSILLVCALVGLGTSHLDVSFREMIGFFRRDGLTKEFIARKPLMAINRHLTTISGEGRPLVLALTGTNVSYFLENKVFWHRSISYPVWGWDFSSLTPVAWREELRRHNVAYVILNTDEEEEHRSFLPVLGEGQPIYSVGTFQLYRL